MLNMPKTPQESSHIMEKRSAESIVMEKMQNRKMEELGLDPYEYDIDREYTEEEQKLILEAMKLITLNEEVPEELAKKVKAITSENL